MEKGQLLYQGKAKELFQTDQPDLIWVEYLNQATALNGAKKDQIKGKGELNNQITSLLFQRLDEKGIRSHFVEQISETEQIIQAVDIIPLEVVVRNIAAGSFSKRLAIPEGTPVKFPIVEFYFKNDELDDPMIIEDHIKVLDIATDEEITTLKTMALAVDEALSELFDEIGIILVDFKLEFGRTKEGTILLADEISPDTCRLWDKVTNEHLDKDIYRRDLGDLIPVYQEVLNRLKGEKKMYFVKVYVTYKDSVLDPQGEAVKGAVHRLGYDTIEDVRIGKYFEIKVAKSNRPIEEMIEEICDKLLANVNMETYRYEISTMEEV
ncbi:phosphoribosylaminoimidazolesuccinocarboxamide synthase [Enterococcus sp. ALS3]|uniref:Multifunctional fusion protein n=2 Tax=Enterococcus alishanensis TaxID=1303817 RepID=A0ABS6TBN1_9ENTE|nr:phosphoribosylaminoimidazolesuccinocarboxamide synthase [Enterococcus alishanensis]